jgi:hypothetical protein
MIRETRPSGPGDAATLRAYVGGLNTERLVELLLEQAAGDWRLRERLLAEAAAATGSTIDLAAWRHRLEAASRPGTSSNTRRRRVGHTTSKTP